MYCEFFLKKGIPQSVYNEVNVGVQMVQFEIFLSKVCVLEVLKILIWKGVAKTPNFFLVKF